MLPSPRSQGRDPPGTIALVAGFPEVKAIAGCWMSFNLEIQPKKGYLHATVTGENSPANVAAYLDAVIKECRSNDCRRVLIEERLVGPRLGGVEIFRIASDGSKRSRGALEALAFVDVNAEGDQMRFAETVAVNRGIPVRLFGAVAEAEAWLRRSNAVAE